ncbi:MAG: hypothetical protein V3U06_09220 [Candidatus Binatia bacterium]
MEPEIPEEIVQGLAHNSHQPTAAGAHLPEFTVLGSDKGLDGL